MYILNTNNVILKIQEFLCFLLKMNFEKLIKLKKNKFVKHLQEYIKSNVRRVLFRFLSTPKRAA